MWENLWDDLWANLWEDLWEDLWDDLKKAARAHSCAGGFFVVSGRRAWVCGIFCVP